MSIWTHKTLILIPASMVQQANQAALSIPGASAADAKTFDVGLNPSGSVNDPPTYFWAAPQLDDAGWQVVQQLEGQFPGSAVIEWDQDNDPGLPDRTLQSMGLKRIQAVA